MLRSTEAMDSTMNGTSTWTSPTTTEPGPFRNEIGRSMSSALSRKSLSIPRRAKITRHPKVRMMMEVRSGAISRKITNPDHLPEWRTRNSATG